MNELSVFIQVVLVDLLFAGDNAIAIGLVAAGLPKEQRKKVITIGVALAVVARIIFAVLTVQLLKIPGLLFIGGLLLLWVCWRLWSDMRRKEKQEANPHTDIGATGKTITFRQALFQILVADISMSLDNVLAVAAIAREHLLILVFGLVLSVVLMVVGATMIANLLDKYKWIEYVGLLIIFVVAGTMLWDGGHEIAQRFVA